MKAPLKYALKMFRKKMNYLKIETLLIKPFDIS